MKFNFKVIDYEKTKFKFIFMKNSWADSNLNSIQPYLPTGNYGTVYSKVQNLRKLRYFEQNVLIFP